ncbi:MAG: signal recognition particle receptor subunit alpha, partial [Planctomycetota bacterium]
MFDSLQEGLGSALKSLRGKAKLSEANMREGLKLVERSLLEADVSYEVVRTFMQNVTEQAVGEKVLKALDPSQQVVGIVHQQLIELMGPVDHSLHLKGKDQVTVLMMCGLQGSGKTTTCGKLGRMLKQRERKPLLVAADLQRPAAIDQLHVLGEQLGIPVFSDRDEKDPVKVCNNAVQQAKKLGADTVILDTAGRLHIDDELMQQLERIGHRDYERKARELDRTLDKAETAREEREMLADVTRRIQTEPMTHELIRQEAFVARRLDGDKLVGLAAWQAFVDRVNAGVYDTVRDDDAFEDA